MAGSATVQARPARPGAYVEFLGSVPQPETIPVQGIVALPIECQWGPENEVTACSSLAEVVQTFDPTSENDAFYAAYGAFKGEGLPGVGGAAEVLIYRLVNDGNPATAAPEGEDCTLNLQAKYVGTYGNTIRYAIADAPGSSTVSTITLTADGGKREVIRYTRNDVTDAAAQVNAKSELVTANSSGSGALGSQSGSFSGGSTDAATSNEWTSALSALEPYRFSLIAAYGLTNGSIHTSLASWLASVNANGKRVMSVIGVGGGDVMGDAEDLASDAGSYNTVIVGPGLWLDNDLNQTVTPAELTARVAGILARRGEAQSLTFARLAGLSVLTGLTDADIIEGIENGITVLARDSHPLAPVRIEKGLTSYQGDGGADFPSEVYSVPKFVRTMGGIEMEITEFCEQKVIGQYEVNDDTRQYVIGEVRQMLDRRVKQGVIQPGYVVGVATSPPPTDADDFIALVLGVTFGRTLEQTFFQINVK